MSEKNRKGYGISCAIVLSFAILMCSQGEQMQTQMHQSQWCVAMRKVHGKFTGQKGTFAQFGDSITHSMAFLATLRYSHRNMPPQMSRAFKIVQGYMRKECWSWKGQQFGNYGGKTVQWALEHVDEWLKRLNPEVAWVMFGTNDLTRVDEERYRAQLRKLVKRILDNGTIVILGAIPPRHGFEGKSAEFAKIARKVAKELKVPFVDFHSEILKRRPNDWDGKLEKFNAYKGYDVPTLIARDGVHPSHSKKYRGDYSQEALNCCGFSLLNYLVVLKYAEVIEKVLRASAP